MGHPGVATTSRLRSILATLLSLLLISLLMAWLLAMRPGPCASLDCAGNAITAQTHFGQRLEPMLHEGVSSSNGETLLIVRTSAPTGEATLFRKGSRVLPAGVEFGVGFPYCCAPPNAALSDDGRYFAIAVDSLYLYSGQSGDLLWRYDLPPGDESGRYFTSVAMGGDGRYLAAASDLGILYFFSTERGQPLWRASIAPGSWPRVAMTPDGRFVAVTSGNSVLLFSAAGPEPVHSWAVGGSLYYAEIALSPDGSWAVASTGGEGIVLHHLPLGSGAPDWERSLGRGLQPYLAVATDGSAIVAANLESGVIQILRPSGEVVSTWSFGGAVSPPSWLEGGRFLGFGVGKRVVLLDWRHARIVGWVEEGNPVVGVWGTAEHLYILTSPDGSPAGEKWLTCVGIAPTQGFGDLAATPIYR